MGTIEYSSMYLEAMKEIKMAHEALIKRNYQSAYEHCLNAQAEMRLMSGAVKSWVETNE